MNVRVTCDCDTCKTNATALGATFPLAADVNPKMAVVLGINSRNATKASKTHGLVYTAHDPSLRGSNLATSGPWAV